VTLSGSGRLAIRAGYGTFYSRPSFFYLALGYFAPPFFLNSDTSGQPFSHPFATAPPESSFPLIQPGSSLAATVIDRNARTPYTQQFNTSVQYELPRNTTLQVAYAGSHGVKLFRGVAVNQAQIASLNHPITNAVTGQVITDNSIENASLRAPLQGVSSAFFLLNQSNAQSIYHSLQTSLNRRFSRGLQFSASYTFSKSIDNASNLPAGYYFNPSAFSEAMVQPPVGSKISTGRPDMAVTMPDTCQFEKRSRVATEPRANDGPGTFHIELNTK
jgi:hypothetical protein